MRKSIALILLGIACALIQVSALNMLGLSWTWNLPLTLIILLGLNASFTTALTFTIATTMTLDYGSVLPFGSFLFVGLSSLLIVWFVAQRFPLRQHHAWQLITVLGVSAVSVLLLLAFSTLITTLRLASWTFYLNIPILVSVLASTVVLNGILTLVALFLRRMLTRVTARLFMYGR